MSTQELIAEYKAALAAWQPIPLKAHTRRDAAFEARLNEAMARLALAAARRADHQRGLAGPSASTEAAAEALEIAKEAHEAARNDHFEAAERSNKARKAVDAPLRSLEARRAELKAIESPSEAEAEELAAIVAEIGE